MTSVARLKRMRTSFERNRSVLVEDYEHFTTPDVPTPPSKAERKSEAPRVRRSPRRS